jgi:hypothetical protein
MTKETVPDVADESMPMTPETLLQDLQNEGPEEENEKDEDDPPTVDAISVDERTSFTADSPYFRSFCENEINSLNTLVEALREISTRTKAYVQTGALMVEGTRRLALSCRLKKELSSDISDEERRKEEEGHQQRRQAVGEEMATLLGLLSNVRFA